MDLKALMTGIAVVIDDAFDGAAADRGEAGDDGDPIFRIVSQLETEWNLPFYKASAMPPENTWPGLLQAASFILLDWRLWPAGAEHLERAGVASNRRFLELAKGYFVPVFIFTNESVEDVAARLPEAVYPAESPDKSFVFVRNKADLLTDGALDVGAIERWVRRNASVYALKTWSCVFQGAKRELFGSMYTRSPDWPRVFWKAYADDGVDPSSSLTHLINDNLRGRMRTSAFEADILGEPAAGVRGEELRELIGEASTRRGGVLPADEIACGDMFRQPRGKVLLNLRPDCDCVPRDGTEIGDVELYCVEGKRLTSPNVREAYENGHFNEEIWASIAFSVDEGRSVRFDFRRFRVARFAELREQRIGRLLHPYLTRIQQRFGLFLQRQGLPRVPEEAIPEARAERTIGGETGP